MIGQPEPVPAAWPVSELKDGIVGAHSYTVKKVSGQGVDLLEESVTTTTQGHWQALGLVRNETLAPVGQIIVSVRLLSGEGTLLEEASGNVLVNPLRPGEPAPFRVTSNVEASHVARTEWSVTYQEPDQNLSRSFFLHRQWVDLSQKSGALPTYRLAIGFKNPGPPVQDIMLTVAFLDNRTGRVVLIDQTTVDPRARRPIPTEGPGGFQVIQVTTSQQPFGFNAVKTVDYMAWAVEHGSE